MLEHLHRRHGGHAVIELDAAVVLAKPLCHEHPGGDSPECWHWLAKFLSELQGRDLTALLRHELVRPTAGLLQSIDNGNGYSVQRQIVE
ncbi:MAG: hypothetical protein ACI88C_003368 [Acidimicrobiales bacterium]|jgi:hypothetical protein